MWKALVVAVALAALPLAGTAQDFNPNEFKGATLAIYAAESARAYATAPRTAPVMVGIDSRLLPIKVRLTFTGRNQPIRAEVKDHMVTVLTTMQNPNAQQWVGTYQREYLFTEGDKSYWIPVQDQVASFFSQELRAGQAVDAYLRVMGYRGAGDSVELLAPMIEFQAIVGT